MGAVRVYGHGLVCASVCAESSLTKEQIESEVNKQIPTGIDSRWRVSEERFRTGEPNGFPCSDGGGRAHWLLTC
jgi:hypothetical protein